MIKIKNKNGIIIYTVDANTLVGADLRRAVLTGADLRGADLRGADLTGAVLTDAVLRDADLRDADLTGAVLRGAVLRGADLTGADLTGAVLRGAVLTGAVLSDIIVNWDSHQLLSELLFREAKTVQRRMVAGIVRISTDWCWRDFLKIKHRERKWALDTLAKFVKDNDGAPKILRKRAENDKQKRSL